MTTLLTSPTAALALRPLACVDCGAKTTQVFVDACQVPGSRRIPSAKCLVCRFRSALANRAKGGWKGEATGLFITGPSRLTSIAAAVVSGHSSSPTWLADSLWRHVRGDFGSLGQFDLALDNAEARDLGPLASRAARNAIAICSQGGDVLSVYPLADTASLYVWTLVSRTPRTLLFTSSEGIEVY
jgi:hypothetical protein